MADERYEYELRCRAIQWHQQGVAFRAILARLGRSRYWLAKWLRRFHAEGWPGLRARSRAPKRQPRTPARVVAQVLAIRQALTTHRTRATRFAGIGAETIRLELERRRVRPVPSLRTIERLLQRHGATRLAPRRHHGGGEPYPAPRVARPGDLQQTDLVGPRYLRGPRGVTRFYSFHTVAVVGRGVATSQARHKSAEAFCTHLVHAWQWLGVPCVSQLDNEMAATGGGRYPTAFSLVMRLHLLVGVHLVFIPPGEPGRNAYVESFNALWQDRVLGHPCADLAALRRMDHAFWRFYHVRKPHRALRTATDGTRYPGPWLAQHRTHLRSLPAGFSLARYRDHTGRLSLPLARGRVSFIRRVDATGGIDVNGRSYFAGKRLAGRYITATIFPHRRALVLKHGRRVHKCLPFPVAEGVVRPLLPIPRGRI